jgi:hypothetical protein
VGIKDHTPKGGTEMPKIEELIPPKIFQEIQEKLREQEKKKPARIEDCSRQIKTRRLKEAASSIED